MRAKELLSQHFDEFAKLAEPCTKAKAAKIKDFGCAELEFKSGGPIVLIGYARVSTPRTRSRKPYSVERTASALLILAEAMG